MKRRLLCGIAVLALAFCALPALAAPANPAAAALAAIFAPAPHLGASSQAQISTRLPGITFRSECSITTPCTTVPSVSCVGETDCFKVNKCYVSCDGQITWCPSHSPDCPD